LASLVLIGVHGQNGLIARSHRYELAVAPKRHADTVGTDHGGTGEGDHESKCTGHQLVAGGD
jgi:hypothetical protein